MATSSGPGPWSLDLAGRIALVTGAAQGLGRAGALALARCGCDVALCDRDGEGMDEVSNLVRRLGRRAYGEIVDVRDVEHLTAFIAAAASALGPLDVVCNNAGGTFHAAFAEISPKGEAMLVAENFTSVTSGVRASLPHLKDGASIVNVTSIEAHRGAPGFSIYAAMKAAVAQLTMTLALELAPRDIRVNAIAPDAIPTPGVEESAAAVGNRGHGAYAHKVPLGLGTSDDFAGVLLFLASPLSRFVTGVTVPCDGGARAASGWEQTPEGTYVP